MLRIAAAVLLLIVLASGILVAEEPAPGTLAAELNRVCEGEELDPGTVHEFVRSHWGFLKDWLEKNAQPGRESSEALEGANVEWAERLVTLHLEHHLRSRQEKPDATAQWLATEQLAVRCDLLALEIRAALVQGRGEEATQRTAELKEKLGQLWDGRLQLARRELEEMEREARAFAEELRAKEAARDRMIQRRLDELIADPAVSWDW